MFKHILVPTDGSPLSEAAISHAVEFAKSIGARITGVHVIPAFHTFDYRAEMLEDTRQQFEKDSRAHAQRFLAKIEQAAQEAGVECSTLLATHDHPYEAIIETARETGCDAIVMASHGRKGIKALLMGSETQKVLTHSTIPVLVYR
ncbi:MAG TPA: universal stress protein [Paucimonas sp.]|nr:universal stress protein [Paucimonas sp.]